MAQRVHSPVKFKNGDLSIGISNRQVFDEQRLLPSKWGSDLFVLLQFDRLPTAEKRSSLAKAGLILGDLIPPNTYLATIKPGFAYSRFEEEGVDIRFN